MKENTSNEKGDSAIPSNLAGTTAHDGEDPGSPSSLVNRLLGGKFWREGTSYDKRIIICGILFSAKDLADAQSFT